MKSFLIITTLNLPEAYFLVEKLYDEKQKISLLNVQGRTFKQSFRVFKRLWKRRGTKYIVGFLLSKLFFSRYNDSDIVPFSEINENKINELRNEIDYFECKDVNSEETKNLIKGISPDYILVAGAPVIQPYIYELAKFATLNRHLGLSPEYRGSDCPIWAMANNDFDKIGYTIHYLSKKVDGGDVLMQKRVSISKDMNFSQARAYVNRQGSEGYWDVIKMLLSNNVTTSKSQSLGGKHYPPAPIKVIRKAVKNFERYCLLD